MPPFSEIFNSRRVSAIATVVVSKHWAGNTHTDLGPVSASRASLALKQWIQMAKMVRRG